MQSVSSRIWTRVAVSISYDDNHYTTGTSTFDDTHYKMVPSINVIFRIPLNKLDKIVLYH